MDLLTYLAQRDVNLSVPQFGEMLGVHRQTMWRYATGQRMPCARRLQQIERLTKGNVTARDFMVAVNERHGHGQDAAA